MQRIISRFSLLAAAALFVGVASAEEQLLYFMVNDPLTFADGTELSANGYSCLMVSVDGGDSYRTIYGGGESSQGTALASGSTEPAYVSLGDSPTDAILFEMWLEAPAGSWERVAYHSANLSDLSAYIGNSQNPSATPYVVSSVVPEPTSGLLMLLGFAGLALRRKRI